MTKSNIPNFIASIMSGFFSSAATNNKSNKYVFEIHVFSLINMNYFTLICCKFSVIFIVLFNFHKLFIQWHIRIFVVR